MTTLYVVRTGRRVELFDDAVEDTPILGVPLSEWQARVARKSGLDVEWIDDAAEAVAPCFVTDDDVFFTERLFGAFVRKARTLRRACRAGLVDNPVLAATIGAHPGAEPVDGGWCWALAWRPSEAASEGPPILFEMDDLLALSSVRLPKALIPDGLHVFCESTMGLLRVDAPLHVYFANLHANLERSAALMTRVRMRAARGAPAEGLDVVNRLGEGCVIDPSAVVEGCELGDGVVIGAHAVVRHSTLGAGVHVQDGVTMMRSVIGRGTMISLQHRVVQSVVYEESFLISGALQFSIMGRESAVFATWVTDMRMDGRTIRTPQGGGLVDTGLRFFGAVIGHRAKVTAGVVTAPGRVVPSGATVHADPRDVFVGLPTGHPVGRPFVLGGRDDPR
jgi:hypothetical protein